MKTKLLCFVFLFGFFSVNAQDSIKKYIKYEHKFDSLKNALNGTTTKVSFGISGNTSNSVDYHKIRSNTELKYGTFPYKFLLNLETETEIKNGKTNDKISDLFISYDYYPDAGKLHVYTQENRYKRKLFIFVSRYSDSYLGIDEKYELGTGVVFNFSNSHQDSIILTKTGIENKTKIKEVRDSGKTHKPAEMDELDQANITKYRIIRPALLFGIFYEVEKMAFFDSIPTDTGLIAYPSNLDATNQIMLEARPTLEFNFTDNLSLSLKCYFKMPISQLRELNTVKLGDTTDARFDYFIDFPIVLNYKVNKTMEFSLRYRFMYDNAPQRRFIALDENRKFLIKPDQRHHSIDLMLTVNF
jgi:hypothetical protein